MSTRGYFTYLELHQFIRKLCARALLPTHVPGILDWKALGDLQGQELQQLSNRDFLHRPNLKVDLDGACHVCVKKDNSKKKLTSPEEDAAVFVNRDEPASKARGYLFFLLGAFLADISQNAGVFTD